jgi:hypothetical protein
MPFDPDRQHPWNRLHRLLYSRTTQEGVVYDQEGLEPPFTSTSRYLIEGPSHEEAINLLDAFLNDRSAEPMKAPLKRAVFQRDLWAVFSTTAGEAREVVQVDLVGRVTTTDRCEDPGDEELPNKAARRALQKHLVQAMRRVALSPREIDALPDNLAQAVKARTFSTAFDPKQPDRAFLPPDLLDNDGPWMVISHAERAENGGVAARHHVLFTKGRSVFLVLLRLPGGRSATTAFLKKLQTESAAQFPEGTQTALLRRALLIDNTGQMRLSPLTESLEVRTFGKLDTGTPRELTLRRDELLMGRSGMHAVGAAETSYFDFQTRAGDVFEAAKLRPGTVVLQTCTSCHSRTSGLGGIHTVLTRYGGGSNSTPSALVPSGCEKEAAGTIAWGRKSYTWGLLQGLWGP